MSYLYVSQREPAVHRVHAYQPLPEVTRPRSEKRSSDAEAAAAGMEASAPTAAGTKRKIVGYIEPLRG